MVPYKDGKANRGHSCVKGRFAWGYANHRERILKPMIRETIDQPWREVSWDVAIDRVASEFKRLQARHGRLADRRHHLVALHQRGDLPGAEAGARRLRQQQCRYLRPRLPFADRLRAEDRVRHVGRHPGFRLRRAERRDHGDRRQSDRRPSGLRLAHEEAAAPGRPADRDRSAPHRPGAHAAYRGRLPPAAAAGHQCRHPERAGACHRHRRPGERGLRPRILRPRRLRALGGLRIGAAEQPGDGRPDGRRVARGDPRRGPSLCHRRQRRDLLRPGRHRAQPGHHGGHGDRQPRHGDRQSWPPGRRRESAARPEQRPGRLRHGFLPARAFRLPAHLRRRHAHPVREIVGPSARFGAWPAHSQHVRCGDRRHLQGHLRAGRGHPAVRSQHRPCHQGAGGDGMRGRPGSVPERDRELRPRFPAGLDLPGEGRHLHQRRTPHQPRAPGHDAQERHGRLGNHPGHRQGDGLRDALQPPRPRSWTRSPG